jgi:undecaprenyl-diphosphatase
MDIIQSIILGAVQGLTEFLPVSSSGHLVIFQKVFNFSEPPIFFDTLVHFATLLAVVFYLRKEIIYILKTLNTKETQKLAGLIVLGTVPIIIVGFSIKDIIEEIFSSMLLVAVSFFITSIILFATYFFKNQKKTMPEITWKDSLFVGLFQALAILPGVSRSGSTVSASIFGGIKREDGFKFSFLLAIPAIFGAFALQLKEQGFQFFGSQVAQNIVGFILAFVFGLISLKILEKVMVKGKLHYFGVYTLLLSVIILIFAI